MHRMMFVLLRSTVVLLLCSLLFTSHAETQQAQSRLFLPFVATGAPELAVFRSVTGDLTTGRIDRVIVGGGIVAGTPLPFFCDYPAWAPSSPRIACAIRELIQGQYHYIAGRIGSFAGDVQGIDGWYMEAAWSPDGTQVLFSGETLELLGLDGSHVTLAGRGYYPSWSPDGRAVAYISGVFDGIQRVKVLPLNGAPPFTIGIKPSYGYTWSPDGKYIAIIELGPNDNIANGWDLVVIDLATRTATRVAEHIYSFAWSPDSTRFAVMRAVDDTPHIVLMERTGTVIRDLGEGIEAVWSPDSKHLLLVKGNDAELITFATDARYHLDYSTGAVWSPDSRTIAFVSEINGAVATLLDVETKQELQVSGLLYAGGLQWSPSSTWLAVPSMTRLLVIRRDGGVVYEYLPEYVQSYRWIR